jgi:hypothetical protein
LAVYIRRLPPYKGNASLVRVGQRTRGFNPQTGVWQDGLDYRLKQLRGDAIGKPGPHRLYRETKSRFDGAPVASVLGKRCGVSQTLTLKAELAWHSKQGRS